MLWTHTPILALVAGDVPVVGATVGTCTWTTDPTTPPPPPSLDSGCGGTMVS